MLQKLLFRAWDAPNPKAEHKPSSLPEYTVIRSNRKTISIQITIEGTVLVRCPNRMPAQAVDAFVREKSDWIKKHLDRKAAQPTAAPFTDAQLQAFSQTTKSLLNEKLPRFAQNIGVTYQRVTVRRQRTRWGSCSSKGNLNFNCLLALVPTEVFDYVVVHELCHRKEMNHSSGFWAEVEKQLPHYKTQRKWLKDHGSSLIRRL
jgi:predicted metal-dependent hydrolase